MPGLRSYPRTWAGDIQLEASDLSTDLRKDVRQVPVSFESTEQGAVRVYFRRAATVTGWRSQITRTLAATDAGTITLANQAGSAMTAAPISHPLSSAVGTVVEGGAITGNSSIAAGGYLTLTQAKTTAGGRALVTIEYTE